MPFTNEEAFEMLMILGECRQNYLAAERLYAERYPNRQHHSRKVFQRLARRVRTTGQVQPHQNRNNQIRRRRDERAADIIAAINLNPHDSTRRIGRESGLSYTTVWRILKQNNLHPYHINLHQKLTEDDFQRRVTFCNWLLGRNRDFLLQILWTDEATFKINGEVNSHNAHYWSSENPHWLREVDNQHLWSLNTWCAIIGQQIIGPYFFDQTLNGNLYSQFLENVLPELLENVPLATRQVMWFQQDGCPAHFSLIARRTINNLFPGKWIGRAGPIAWPARSPDLTPLDFYLWGRIKDLVYQQRPTTKENMKQRIREACHSLNPAEVLRAVESVRQRMERCLHQGGRQFEHL